MELLTQLKRRGRAVRLVAAAVLAGVAVRSLRNGKRLRGLLAAGGAVAVGTTTPTLDPAVIDDEQLVDVAIETDQLQCSVCEAAIVPGQSRRPNADNEPAHEACL